MKQNYSLGAIERNLKMEWVFSFFLGAGYLKSAVTFEISVPKLFFLLKMLYEDFYYEIYSTFIKLNYSLGEIERNLKMKLFFFCVIFRS